MNWFFTFFVVLAPNTMDIHQSHLMSYMKNLLPENPNSNHQPPPLLSNQSRPISHLEITLPHDQTTLIPVAIGPPILTSNVPSQKIPNPVAPITPILRLDRTLASANFVENVVIQLNAALPIVIHRSPPSQILPHGRDNTKQIWPPTPMPRQLKSGFSTLAHPTMILAISHSTPTILGPTMFKLVTVMDYTSRTLVTLIFNLMILNFYSLIFFVFPT